MISIIICSVNKYALDKVSQNIARTIGVDFEIIAIDNAATGLGICAVYNIAAARAKFDVFCFIHEDIYFETAGWGQKVAAHLSSKEFGLIGLAGGSIKSRVPSSWASLIYPSEVSYIQHFKNPKREIKMVRTHSPQDVGIIKKVVCIDGFWMCTTREVFGRYQFDEKIFRGFHGYDIDFSLQVFTAYKVGVVFDIIAHHFSEGSFDKTWLINAMAVSRKWGATLPFSVDAISHETLLRQHWTAMQGFIDKMLSLEYSLPEIVRYYFAYAFGKYFYWKHFLHFFKYLLTGYFKKRPEIKSVNEHFITNNKY
ncbi:glycosyltransferase [Ferruginibacter paludis]|uniref:glycosyltransferase n=1 Tax=Ferruginibacter paludis TaxID=1310417 RepID=UPI0025B440F4|nr:glycosyltransferase [Ferruginibacter paludis]MDN3656731.1 glycosyltransferase [Ferruginibacter paludis]